jgi:hypothetical protein
MNGLHTLSVNFPIARSRNVAVKAAKRRIKETFFRKAAILKGRNVNEYEDRNEIL